MAKQEVFLSISAKSRKLGVSIFSKNHLIFYGQRTLIPGKDSAAKSAAKIIKMTICEYQPKYLVIDELAYKQQQVRSFILIRQTITRIAKNHHLEIKTFSLDVARRYLCPDRRPIKPRIAEILIRSYPELTRFTPTGSSWHLKYYQPLFNAVVLGIYRVETLNENQAVNQSLDL